MAAFSTTDSTIQKISLLQATSRGYLVRKRMSEVKTLYKDIVEGLEGRESAEELQWSFHGGLAFPVHKQKKSELELIMKKLREKESSQEPKAGEEKKYSYSSASFESESSSSGSSTSGRNGTSGGETGSTSLKVSLNKEGELSPENSRNDCDKSVGVDSAGQISSKSSNTATEKVASNHLGNGQTLDSFDNDIVSPTYRAGTEKTAEQERISSEDDFHGCQEDALSPLQDENGDSAQVQSLSGGNLSHSETKELYSPCESGSIHSKNSAMTTDKVSLGNSGETDQRGKNVKDEDRFEMGRCEVGESKWTNKGGDLILEKMENVKEDEDSLRDRIGEKGIDQSLSGERISNPEDKVLQRQVQIDTLEKKELDFTSSIDDDVNRNSTGREKKKVNLTTEEVDAENLEGESVARNLERGFQSVESQGVRHHEADEAKRNHGQLSGDPRLKSDADEASDSDGESFIPPSPILPQGLPKRDNLLSSPLPPRSCLSPKDIPEKLTEETKGLMNGQNECDAESTVLTKVTNMTSLSLWNDDTSVWNSEEDTPVDSPSLPEDLTELQNLRKNIAMELLWVQQAIQSRKAYLRLKENLGSQAED